MKTGTSMTQRQFMISNRSYIHAAGSHILWKLHSAWRCSWMRVFSVFALWFAKRKLCRNYLQLPARAVCEQIWGMRVLFRHRLGAVCVICCNQYTMCVRFATWIVCPVKNTRFFDMDSILHMYTHTYRVSFSNLSHLFHIEYDPSTNCRRSARAGVCWPPGRPCQCCWPPLWARQSCCGGRTALPSASN